MPRANRYFLPGFVWQLTHLNSSQFQSFQWFDEEGDFLEVTFAKRKGSFRSVGPDIFERVDAKGKVIGFAIFNFLKHDRKTVEIPLEEAKLAIGR